MIPLFHGMPRKLWWSVSKRLVFPRRRISRAQIGMYDRSKQRMARKTTRCRLQDQRRVRDRSSTGVIPRRRKVEISVRGTG